MASHLIGIDIGGTKSAVVLGNSSGTILARAQIVTSGAEETLTALVSQAKAICTGNAITACGISCGGPLSSREGLILSPPNLPGWDRVPVVKVFEESLGVATRLENDANAAALAEWEWGLHRSVDDLVYLTCGTGQGAGIILGGRLHRGRQDLAGEIGHVRLRPSGPAGYGKAGSLEGLTSGTGLGKLAAILRREAHAASVLDPLSDFDLDGKAVGNAALAGDPFARAVVAKLAGYLGEVCGILIDLLNPQRISLGSMAQRLDALLLDGVREAAQREALPAAFEACWIDKAALGDRAQDLAALAVAKGADA